VRDGQERRVPGVQELLVIAVVALLVFGPERLPEVARTAARAIARFRREAQRNIAEVRRIAAIDELERELRDAGRELRDVGVDMGVARPRRGDGRRGSNAPAAPGATGPRAADDPPPTDPDAT
jgi:sec-independent protein translocase protein TatB